MLKRILIAVCLTMTGMATQAGIIEYNGYSRDESDKVVMGYGLEWLKWDVTKNMSINTALANNNGWRVASNSEMAALFNDFGFGKSDWSATDENEQKSTLPYTDTTESASNSLFIDLFGVTFFSSNEQNGAHYYDRTNPMKQARAIFGDYQQAGDFMSLAKITDDALRWDLQSDSFWFGKKVDHTAVLSGKVSIDANSHDMYTGVALVRDLHFGVPDNIAVVRSVPEPSVLSLLALGLGGLFFRRRRQALHA